METILLIIAAALGAFWLFDGITSNDSDKLFYGIVTGGFLATYLLSVEVRTFINETLRSTESCTEWYFEEMYDAAKDQDFDDFIDLKRCMNEWIMDLDDQEIEDFVTASMEWTIENPSKVGVAESFESQYNL